MICKFCGMDSATPDVCSWCGKSLAASESKSESKPGAGADAPPPIGTVVETVETPAGTVNLNAESAAPPLSHPTASAPAPPTPLAGGSMPAPAPSSAPRKFAPAVPPPSSQNRPRTPAPGALPPSTRPATPSAPLTGRVSEAPAPFSLTGEQAPTVPPETLMGRVPPAAAPAPTMTPSLLEQADTLATPSASASERITTRPLQTSSQPSASVQEAAQTAIGTGVAPAWTPNAPAPAPAAATMPNAAQRKAAVDAELLDSGPSPLSLLLRYIGVFALILVVLGGVAFLAKPLYVVPMLIAMFVGALLLPVMRVSPWADEDSDDLVWFVLLTLLFGPLVALIIYGAVSVMRQGFNASILGCLVVAALARIVGEVATSGKPILHNLFAVTSPFTTFRHIDARLVEVLLLDWSGFVALAGWYAASTFHKEDE